jgi:PAS domain S-box-containing protein
VRGVVVSSRDVTARWQTQQALRDSQEKLRAVVGSAPVVLYSLDREGRFTFSDGRGLRDLGLEPGQVVGESVYKDFGEVPGLRENIQRALAGETVQYLALYGARAYETLYAPQVDEKDEIVGVLAVSVDITERRRLEEQVLQSQKMEAVGRLAGGIAHDFNNLVTAILGYADLLESSFDPQDPRRADVVQVSRAAEHAADLTRRLLTFARRQASEPRVLDVNELVDHLQRMLTRVLGEEIHLLTSLAPSVWPVKVDASQLEQVLLNLVLNARDAMPEGGMVSIRTENVEVATDAAESRAPSPGSYVRIAVSDTGLGLTPEAQAHLFEPFFTTKAPGKGTGLGLATCYGIVTQAGGHIAARSEAGRGTTFFVWLPRTHVAAASGRPRGDTLAPAPADETVLLVEDESLVREVAERTLRQAGYTVVSARDARRAVELARRHEGRLDILVADVSMPHMSGRQLAAEVRALHPAVRTLFMSAFADEDVRGQVQSEGAQLLWKPFTRDALARAVRAVLDGPSPRP